MAKVENLITDDLDIWSSAVKAKSAAGRGTSKKIDLYGIKRLRELILELAVHGLLVPQDPRDESAAIQLEKAATEKTKLLTERKIRNQNPLPPVTPEEEPYNVPHGWFWVRFPDIAFFQEGPGIMAKDFREAGVPLIRISGMHSELVSLEGCNFLDKEMVDKKWAHFRLDLGDVILSSSASLGKVAKVGEEVVGSIVYTGLIRFRTYSSLSVGYLTKFLESNEFARQINKSKTGAAIKHFGPTHLKTMLIPIPSLSEQHRIATKVDELMALCDQLEQQQEASISAHQTLVTTLLGALTTASEREGFAAAWARIAEHFDTLFTTEWSIDQLKQTILQLAVMGKLVPQDPNDEPASELLERIAMEKEQLIKDKKIKKQKTLPEIGNEEKPFDLPKGWVWARVGSFSLLKGGFAYQSKEFVNKSDFQVIRMGNIRPDFLRLNENPAFITSKSAKSTHDYRLAERDILLTMTGTKGKRDYLYSLVVKRPDIESKNLYLNQRLCMVRPLKASELFLNLAMKSEMLLDSIYAKSTGTANQANIGMEAIFEWVIPLPPMEEQYRIVAKVGEFMALSDTLKSHIHTAQATQLQLADAMIT
jgi:type I restriction enzyme S subunit